MTTSGLCCSFCHKSQDTVDKLISNPGDYPRAYICSECIVVCANILDDDRLPLSLMTAIERWIRQESQGLDATRELDEVRRIATGIVITDPRP